MIGSSAFLRTLATTFLLASILFAGLKLIPENEVRNVLTWAEAKRRIAERLESPKLILAGGSATWFGIRARYLSEKLGVPAVNMGLHAGLGQEFLLDFALSHARSGDLVIWSPEFETLMDPFYPQLAFNARLALQPETVDAWSMTRHAFFAPLSLPDRLLPSVNLTGPYSTAAIGEFGDQLENEGTLQPPVCLAIEGRVVDFGLIERLLGRAHASGVTILFRYPITADAPCNDALERVAEEIRRFLHERGVTVLNTFAESRAPPADFFNTRYHLTGSAAMDQSIRLASRLDPIVAGIGLTAATGSAQGRDAPALGRSVR